MSDSFAALWTVARQAPLSMRFPRQECWSGLPFPPPADLPDPGINPHPLHQQVDCLPLSHQGRAMTVLCAKSLQSCSTLCDPMDSSPPGSSFHGILQARILQWVAISSSRGSSRPRDGAHVSCISCIGRHVLYY